MRIKKIIRRLFLGILIFLVMIFCTISIILTDNRMNGFVGVTGIIRLEITGRRYVVLDNSPYFTRLLIRGSESREFLREYFDEFEEIKDIMNDFTTFSDTRGRYITIRSRGDGTGRGTRNGVRYSYSIRVFAGNYNFIGIFPE